ncbi:MAG: hypothetical protein L0J68_13200 [Micrococcaceae bacterium]|nr:hypothetical protein [Micrococcaceae bacterium]
MTKKAQGRSTVLFAKILNKDAQRKEYELELIGGDRLTIDTTEVDKIEEYVCPATGNPVAKVTLDEESEVRTVARVRDLVAHRYAADGTPRPIPLHVYDGGLYAAGGRPTPMPVYVYDRNRYVYDVRTTGW